MHNQNIFNKIVINRLGKMYNLYLDLTQKLYWMSYEKHPIAKLIEDELEYFVNGDINNVKNLYKK